MKANKFHEPESIMAANSLDLVLHPLLFSRSSESDWLGPADFESQINADIPIVTDAMWLEVLYPIPAELSTSSPLTTCGLFLDQPFDLDLELKQTLSTNMDLEPNAFAYPPNLKIIDFPTNAMQDMDVDTLKGVYRNNSCSDLMLSDDIDRRGSIHSVWSSGSTVGYDDSIFLCDALGPYNDPYPELLSRTTSSELTLDQSFPPLKQSITEEISAFLDLDSINYSGSISLRILQKYVTLSLSKNDRLSIVYWYATTAQKSYSTEKRYLNCPPKVWLEGSWSDECKVKLSALKADKSEFSKSYLNGSKGLKAQLDRRFKEGKEFELDMQDMLQGEFQQLYMHDLEKEKNLLYRLNVVQGKTDLLEVLSGPVKVLSKPTKSNSSASAEVLSGTSIALFNRIMKQASSMRYLGVENSSLIPLSDTWDCFVVVLLTEVEENLSFQIPVPESLLHLPLTPVQRQEMRQVANQITKNIARGAPITQMDSVLLVNCLTGVTSVPLYILHVVEKKGLFYVEPNTNHIQVGRKVALKAECGFVNFKADSIGANFLDLVAGTTKGVNIWIAEGCVTTIVEIKRAMHTFYLPNDIMNMNLDNLPVVHSIEIRKSGLLMIISGSQIEGCWPFFGSIPSTAVEVKDGLLLVHVWEGMRVGQSSTDHSLAGRETVMLKLIRTDGLVIDSHFLIDISVALL